MNTEELEEKIWRYANEWISKSKLHVRVGGDKKACFDRIDLMIPMQLKVKKYKNRIMVCRVDTSRRAEFDNGLVFQKNMLGLMRDELKKYPKPMFTLWHEIIHYIPPLTKENFKEFQKEYNVKYSTLVTVLKESDIVSLNINLTDQTRNLIDKTRLKLMKPDSILINTSRGEIVDEVALYNALKNGKLAGAALDVFQQEPYSGPLTELDNVVLTPHIGSYAKEIRIQMEIEAAQNLVKGLLHEEK